MKIGKLLSLRMVLFTKDSGKVQFVMVSVYKYGQMEQSTWESGERIKPMEKADSSMLMEMFMMAFGLMIKLMAMVSTNI